MIVLCNLVLMLFWDFDFLLQDRPDPTLCHYSLCDSRRLCCQHRDFELSFQCSVFYRVTNWNSSLVTLQFWKWFSLIVGSFSFETLDIVCRETFVLKPTSYNRKIFLRKNPSSGQTYVTGVNIGANRKISSSAAIWTHWCVNNSLFGIGKIWQKLREKF